MSYFKCATWRPIGPMTASEIKAGERLFDKDCQKLKKLLNLAIFVKALEKTIPHPHA